MLADIFEREAKFIPLGARAQVRYQGQTFAAEISDALPAFDPVSRTLKVRLDLDNPAYILRPDMFVDVEMPVQLPAAVTVPADAVLDAGRQNIVYVDRGNGTFEPRPVETGWRFGDLVAITKGLDPGEHIVVSGTFLIDSESRFRSAAASWNQAPPKEVHDPVCGMGVDPGKADRLKGVFQGTTYYFCSESCKRKFEAHPQSYVSADGRPAQKPS